MKPSVIPNQSILRRGVAALAVALAAAFLFSSQAAAASALKDGLYAEIKTSRASDPIVLMLEFEKTPLTVCNFVALAEGQMKNPVRSGKRYFDGLNFHRVIPNFMIQGGCPEGSGRGNPGYKFADEIHPSLKHSGPGILSMANSGPGSNGSQFFITHVATPHLDGKHTVFGHVVSGQNVVNAVQKGDTIDKVTIRRVGAKAKAFKADQAVFDKLQAAAAEAASKAAMERFPALKAGLEYLAANKKKEGVTTTKSGLQYKWLKKAAGAKPKSTDTVTVHYRGYHIDGKEFDSSYKRNEPISFPLNGVIPGWSEGVQLCSVGSKIQLAIPFEIAYGARGRPPVIPAYSTLLFDIELIAIK